MTLVARLWLLVLGAVLIHGATTRALSFPDFWRVLQTHELIPAPIVTPVGWGVLGWEWIIGAVCVACGLRRSGAVAGSVAAVSLLSGLTVYLAFLVVARGAHAGCGCGPVADMGAGAAIIRSALLVAIPAGHLGWAGLSPRRPPAAGGGGLSGLPHRRPSATR